MNRTLLSFSLLSFVFGVTTLFQPTSSPAFSLRTILEYDHANRSNSLLNPDNILEYPTERAETIVLLDDAYNVWDGNLAGSLRLNYRYLKGRSYKETKMSAVFNELFYHKEVGNFAGSIGREKVRWGVGYAASPTDIITTFRNARNPEDRLQVLEGSDLFRLSFSKETSQMDIVYFPDLEYHVEDADVLLVKHRVGLRYYRYLEPVECSFIGKLEEQGDWAAGVNGTVTFGNALELHGEYLFTSLNERLYPQFALPPFAEDGGGVHDLLIGTNYTFKNHWNAIVEYIYSSRGFNQSESRDYYEILRLLDRGLGRSIGGRNPLTNLIKSGLEKIASASGTPLRQHYVFTRLYKDKIYDSFSLEWFGVVNLNDGSGFQVLQPKYTGSDAYDIYLRIENTWGKQVSEFGLALADISVNIGMNLFWGN